MVFDPHLLKHRAVTEKIKFRGSISINNLMVCEVRGYEMLIYGLKNCDNCRKAMKAFPNAQLVDVRAEGLPDDVLDKALIAFEGALLNTRSTTWRALDEDGRNNAPRALIKAHPTLMKRPLIAVDNQLFLGWSSAIEAELKAIS
tara:strand:- start:176 stop:607 length:432 start_codon:yes stop_codon:yes gene_type:complete